MAEEISILKIGSQIKEAFSKFSHLQLGEGFGKLAELGGDVINFGVSAFTAFLIVDILQNENLKTRQKILPTIGYSLGILVTLPLAIFIIAGVAALIPPFIFAASCVSVVRDTATYMEERSERNNLNKELISTKELVKKITEAKLAPLTEKMVQDYLHGRDKLYTQLYAARQAIITNGKLGVQDKKAKVLAINKIIEDFYSANQDPTDKQIPQLQEIADRLKESGYVELNQQLLDYKQVCQSYSQASLPVSLKKSITLYQFSHEKIYSQDLPVSTKQRSIQLIEGKKIKEDDLKLLYSELGNRYLNQTPLMQINVQDDNFQGKLKDNAVEPDKIALINEYNQQPRKAYDQIIQLREAFPTLLASDPNKENIVALFEKFRKTFIDYPDSYHEEWIAFKELFAHKNALASIENELINVDVTSQRFNKLPIHAEQQSYVTNHRKMTFTQFANSHQAEFPAPRFNFDLKANDLLERSGLTPSIRKVFSKLDKGFNKVSEKVKEKVLRKIAMEDPNDEEALEKNHHAQMSETKKAMRKDFNQRYQGIFNVVEKKERLNFLIKSVPRRLINIGLASVVALTSLATTIIIPAVTTPAAPAAAIATTILGVLSAALSAASLANSGQLIYKNIKGKLKLRATHTAVTEGVVPNIGYDEQIQKLGKEKIAKRDAKEAKEEAKSTTSTKETPEVNESALPASTIPETATPNESRPAAAVMLAKIIQESKPSPLKPIKKSDKWDTSKRDKKP